MRKLTRRDVCTAISAVIAATVQGARGLGAQVHPSQVTSGLSPTPSPSDRPGAVPVGRGSGMLAEARVFQFDKMPVRTMANGGESRDIAHGTLATGETVNLHQSMQTAGATSNPPHVIRHTEFILIREGELDFEHEANGQMVSERVGPGGVIYVAYGTRHTVKNVGDGPARYFVVAIGGDAK